MKHRSIEFAWPSVIMFVLAAAPAVYPEQRSFTISVQEKTIDIGSGLNTTHGHMAAQCRAQCCACVKAIMFTFIW